MNNNTEWTQNLCWLTKLINKITKDTSPLNDYFEWWNGKYCINVMSGQEDFAIYDIYNYNQTKRLISFDFDYYTKTLTLTEYSTEYERITIINAFKSIYGYVLTVEDELSKDLLDSIKELKEEIDNNKEDYDEEFINQINDNIEKLDAMAYIEFEPNQGYLQPLINQDYQWVA